MFASALRWAALLAVVSASGAAFSQTASPPPAADDAPSAVVQIPAAPAPVPSPTATPAPAPAVPTPTETPAPAAAPPAPAPIATAPPAPEITPAAAVENPPLPEPRPSDKVLKRAAIPAAQDLFSRAKLPSIGKAAAIGYYPNGCLQGGVELPPDGPTWEVMRLSRNRNWGHPELVKFLERFAPLAAKATGWHGILIGDMAQPRGGPLPFGHKSHQVGLDVDIWFMPKPDRTLTHEEREKISAINLVADDWKHVNPKTWTPADIAFIRTAAEQPEVERVLVNAAIKKELCRVEKKSDHAWMAKVRPWYGHHDHIHVRLKCPADSPHCRKQPPVPGGDGCSNKELAFWFSDRVLHPKPRKGPPAKPLTMAQLPGACKAVLAAPANTKAAQR
jgi:penicillin-insensitive murein endopeptidase